MDNGLATFFASEIQRIPNALMQAYLSPANMACVASEIEKLLHSWTGIPFKVLLDDQLQLTMERILQDNYAAYSYQVADGVRILNKYAIDHEAQVHFLSYRQQQLYKRYFLTQDRMRVEPRPFYDRALKGEQLLDTGAAYGNASPWAKKYPEFMKEFNANNGRRQGDWAGQQACCKAGYPEAVCKLRYP